MQGRFAITISNGQEVASNGISGVTTYDRSTGELREFSGAEMPLQQLKSRVKRAVTQ
jgi:hypothetical protein